MFLKVLGNKKQVVNKLNKIIPFNFLSTKNSRFTSSLKSAKLSGNEDTIDLKIFKDAIKSGCQNLQSNYEPVSQADKEGFLTENRWVLFDKESTKRMELRKSTGEFDISVIFSNIPPEMTSMDESGILIII